MEVQKRHSTKTELEMSVLREATEVKDEDNNLVMENLGAEHKIEELGSEIVTALAGKLEALGESVHEIHVKFTIYSD